MLNIQVKKHTLRFKRAAGTSRGVLQQKPSWFFIIKDTDDKEKVGYGECGLLPNLSFDDKPGYSAMLEWVKNKFTEAQSTATSLDLTEWPSIRFGLEMAVKDFTTGGNRVIFSSAFTEGRQQIPINGLIWMGDKTDMFQQIKIKMDTGWRCIKIKIGAIDFDDEIALLKYIRSQFTSDELEIRLDANGAFSPDTALIKLARLSDFDLHSIEQPIAARQLEKMAEICSKSPLPIALDEELIGVHHFEDRLRLLEVIKPKFIIIKPSLIGGFQSSREWIEIAHRLGIEYWVTSALESNIGLNAIAQWTATLGNNMYQGLGTGQLYANNFSSPLEIVTGHLKYNRDIEWDLKLLDYA